MGRQPISGLPEIGTLSAQVGNSRLAVARAAMLRDASQRRAAMLLSMRVRVAIMPYELISFIESVVYSAMMPLACAILV
jgi:hypothetical protein